MNGKIAIIFCFLLAFFFSGCANASVPSSSPPALTYEQKNTFPASNPAPACVISVTPASPGPELSLQEDLAIHPPPPCNLTAKWTAGGIELRWDVPPAVPVPHGYSDEILYYNVYRRTASEKFSFLEQTASLSFIDQAAKEGVKYYYTVTALHANGIESKRADEVTTLP